MSSGDQADSEESAVAEVRGRKLLVVSVVYIQLFKYFVLGLTPVLLLALRSSFSWSILISVFRQTPPIVLKEV